LGPVLGCLTVAKETPNPKISICYARNISPQKEANPASLSATNTRLVARSSIMSRKRSFSSRIITRNSQIRGLALSRVLGLQHNITITSNSTIPICLRMGPDQGEQSPPSSISTQKSGNDLRKNSMPAMAVMRTPTIRLFWQMA